MTRVQKLSRAVVLQAMGSVAPSTIADVPDIEVFVPFYYHFDPPLDLMPGASETMPLRWRVVHVNESPRRPRGGWPTR